MWIGSIRLVVPAGAGNRPAPRAVGVPAAAVVPVALLRDGLEVARLRLDLPEDGATAFASRTCDYLRLDRASDRTPLMLHDAGGRLLPYPEYGVEYSQGLFGHLRVRLLTDARTAASLEGVTMFVHRLRHRVVGPRQVAWVEDEDWSFLGTWGCGIPLSHHVFRQPIAVCWSRSDRRGVTGHPRPRPWRARWPRGTPQRSHSRGASPRTSHSLGGGPIYP